MDKDTENKILKQLIGTIIDDIPGTYPKSISGVYEKRTDYMDGYNAGVFASFHLILDIMNGFGIQVNDGDNCIDEPEVIFE